MYSFYDIAQAIRYLTDSIVTYKKTPFYIQSVVDGGGGKDFLLIGHKLGEKTSLTLNVEDKDISLKPVQLGLVPIGKEETLKASFWLCRMPIRQWKIGLASENALARPLTPLLPEPEYSWMKLVTSPGVRQCMMGVYPSFDECRKLQKDHKKKATAFSREWGMSESHLYYKATGIDVGTVTDNSVTLHEDYLYLQESLNEAMK